MTMTILKWEKIINWMAAKARQGSEQDKRMW